MLALSHSTIMTRKDKVSVFVLSFLIALIALGSAFSLFTIVAASSGPTFSSAVNLSNDAAVAKDPTVSNNGQNVYVAWTEGGKGIYFKSSADGGATWTPLLSQMGMKYQP